MDSEVEATDVVFSCCYCARFLNDETPDWIGVSLYDKDSGELLQAWFAHELCFRQRLHPDYDVMPLDDETPPFESESR